MMRQKIKSLSSMMMFAWLAIAPALADSSWLPVLADAPEAPVASVTRCDWTGVELWIEIPGLHISQATLAEGAFTRLELPGENYTGSVGAPRIPVIRRVIELPLGGAFTVSAEVGAVQEISLADEGFGGLLLPVQPPVPKCGDEWSQPEFVFEPKAYAIDEHFPPEAVRVVAEGMMRGHRLVTLEIAPVSYNAALQQLRVAGELAVTIACHGADPGLTRAQHERYRDASFEAMIAHTAINGLAFDTYEFPPEAPVSYLVVCADAYNLAIQPWVTWKEQAGFDVTVALTSQTGSTNNAIKTYIQNAYTMWPNPPSFVLLVGDTDTIPHFTGTASGSADDMPYTELDGQGYWTPDVLLGRWPVRDVSDIAANVSKSLEFEQATMPSMDYFKDSLWLASSDHASMLEATHAWCFNNHVQPYDGANTMHQVYERVGGGTSQFASNVNSGRGIVCYSGHGYGDGSGTASVHFVSSNVRSLTNAHLYGHVMVFACGVNLHNQTESFGEVWVNEENKGSVTFWGTSNSSYWDEDDAEQRGIYDAMHTDGYWAIAAALYQGLIDVHTQYPSNATYYFNIYNLMGDPSLPFRARIPQQGTMICPETLIPAEQDVSITVQTGGFPVAGALVSAVMNGERLAAAFTNQFGVAILHITPPEPGTLTVRAIGHNLDPVTQEVMVLASGCGAIMLDRTSYNCDQIVTIRLFDADLNINPGALDTTYALLSSNSEPMPEAVALTETEPDTGEFLGTIRTSASESGPGYLLLSHGDTIVAGYQDADCEGSPADVEDTATADCVGPAISNIFFGLPGTTSFSVTWTTNEPADSGVFYGVTWPPQNLFTQAGMTTDHTLEVTGLDPCAYYYVAVASRDAGGNLTVDDANGQFHRVITRQLVVALSANMDLNPNWTTTGQWAWGDPTGAGGDPGNGHTGTNVYGYNLNGTYPNSMPEYALTTPTLDCSEAGQVLLSFYRWLGVESSTYDHAKVQVSNNNGSTWTTLWENESSSMQDTSWTLMEFDISDEAGGASMVKIRWTMGPTDSSVTYSGWNIDDVLVTITGPCDQPTPTPPPPTATPTPAATATPTMTWTPTRTPSPEPTDTPFPTETPLPTETPEAQETEEPTVPPAPTNTPAPTATPGPWPTATEQPEPTPTPADGTGSWLTLSSLMFRAGDRFLLTCQAVNMGQMVTVNQYVILDVYGAYYFWPSWTPSLDNLMRDLPADYMGEVDILLDFIWPEGAGAADGILFYSAFTDPGNTQLIGGLSLIEWGFE